MPVRVILTDIEGTTSSISFVKDVLFPYATQNLAAYVRVHIMDDFVQAQLQATLDILIEEGITHLTTANTEALIQALLNWIAEDRKVTPLKALQGRIWENGYRHEDYQAHVYPDAVAQLQHWHQENLPIYIYSSGSVEAQKLFFEFSQYGNLLPLFSGHFDTLIGAKINADSYRTISTQLAAVHAAAPAEILFLSDVEAELDAARDAGMQTCWLIRDGELPEQPAHRAVRSFDDIQPELL
ncbi:acireductone synthase [Parathalassolituus penaei]|uniref:Enolase-phosphatase E1 n=1 Tax=Parathalassolituus penaei TaxID=2997323 RepID=A0A9X3EBZ0_9GAMM|nr:acireductone synthase [Parathalassolituus penaei]MCY0964365.1 acireductone synthase [Parathalassolituus penaei]